MKSDIVWINKRQKKLNPKRFIFQLLIPVVLIGSDIGIAYYFYYAGSTGMFEISNFLTFITTMELNRLLLVFVVAIVITMLVECAIRASHLEK